MNRSRVVLSVCVMLGAGFGAAVWMSSPSTAQVPFNDPRGSAGLEGVPAAALLTDRGQQLANRLRTLRRNREVMGSKHPALDGVKKEIKAIEEQLKAWAPSSGVAEPNPFSGGAAAKERNSAKAPKMNDVDLSQIVLRLNERVIALEKRVAVLEGR